MRITEQYLYHTILVHVSRTWERVRIQQENQEMPYDNIESVDYIVAIADFIMADKVIIKFYNADIDNWDWSKETEEGFLDIYVENLALDYIYSEILGINNISKEDYVIWDIEKNEPIEGLDNVYHFTTIIEMLNNYELSIQDGEEFKCVAELPLSWKIKINRAIEQTK